MPLSIAERRHLTGTAYTDPDFRARLAQDPGGTLASTFGRSFAGERIEVVQEGADWAFLMLDASDIDPVLPEAINVRSAVENDVYAMLRDYPEAHGEIERDPKGFLESRLGIDTGSAGVALHHEAPGTLLVILPNTDVHEELSDDLLDLVSAGGQPAVNGGDPSDPNLRAGMSQ